MWNKFLDYLRRQSEEVSGDRTLRLYGFFLCLTIPLSYFFWRWQIDLSVKNVATYCWPFWPGCGAHPLRNIGELGIKIYWIFAIGLSLWAALHFLFGKASLALWGLGAAFLMKGMQQTVDYTFMGNYHYMPYLAVSAFILVSGKKPTLRLLVVLFYFFAGLLKLHPEWMMGVAIPSRIPWMSEQLFQTGLSYVVILELVFVWGLLSSRRMLRAFALMQLTVFHLVSWNIVGYFYPITMFLLLSLFFLELPQKISRTSQGAQMRLGGYCFVGVFLLAQLFPWLSGKDPAIYTHWRLPSLNMFDAAIRCEAGMYIKRKGETIEYIPDYSQAYGIRVRCDPILLMGEAENLCNENAWDPDFVDVDVQLTAKRTTGRHFEPVLRETNVCSRGKE